MKNFVLWFLEQIYLLILGVKGSQLLKAAVNATFIVKDENLSVFDLMDRLYRNTFMLVFSYAVVLFLIACVMNYVAEREIKFSVVKEKAKLTAKVVSWLYSPLIVLGTVAMVLQGEYIFLVGVVVLGMRKSLMSLCLKGIDLIKRVKGASDGNK